VADYTYVKALPTVVIANILIVGT
ncbi:unnamed protein product, partial [Didymodactylos carnosus]